MFIPKKFYWTITLQLHDKSTIKWFYSVNIPEIIRNVSI